MDVAAIYRVVIAHNPVGAGDDPSTADVLAQVELVAAGLDELGVLYRKTPVVGWRPWETIPAGPGTVVFNLVEAPPGVPHVHPGTAAALELMGLPFTGSPAAALWLTTDKLATRALLKAEGLPVAPGGRLDLEKSPACPGPWMIKPACEDASIGLEGDPVCSTPEAVLARGRELAERFPGQGIVVERFLPGREFNVSLLAREGDVEVLPVAEILFEGFPEGMSRVVGWEAKWEEDSFAYVHTVRRFPESPEDEPLLERVREICRAAWKVCGLAGYARVDLRLDEAGEPRILEVNANPCLAVDAGFMAAAAKAGLGAGDVVRRILEAVPREISVPDLQARSRQTPALEIRRDLRPGDREPLEELIRKTGLFNPEEVDVALELIADRIAGGEASHYRFLVGEAEGRVAGYVCWGPIPGTAASADLYWIVVHPDHQGKGIGAALLEAAEEWMAACGRNRVYIETSTREQYTPTRAFYLACGYRISAEFPDFYVPGDGKAVFLKVLG